MKKYKEPDSEWLRNIILPDAKDKKRLIRIADKLAEHEPPSPPELTGVQASEQTIAQRLDLIGGKYTKRMAELSDTQIHGLLWLIGEFAVRSFADEFESIKGHPRRGAALKAIISFSKNPMTFEETLAYIRASIRMVPEGAATTLSKNKLDFLIHRVPGGVVAITIDGIAPVMYFKPCDDNRDAVREIHEAITKAKAEEPG